MHLPSLPFTILILAPFAGNESEVWTESPLAVDPSDFTPLFEKIGPNLSVSLPRKYCRAGGLDLRFKSFKELTPDGMLGSHEYFRQLLAARDFLTSAEKSGMSGEEITAKLTQWPLVPPLRIADAGNADPGPQTGVGTAEASIDKILSLVSATGDTGLAWTADSLAEQIDTILANVLAIIFEDPLFRRMESAWQGLRFLARSKETAEPKVELLIVPVSEHSLEETMDNCMVSFLDEPPSCIFVDHGFDSSTHSINMLANLAELGQTLLVPVVSWIKPAFFNISSWNELDRLSYLPNYLDENGFVTYRKLQDSPAGRWLALVANRFMIRYPYGPENKVRQCDFQEESDPWVSPIWGMAALLRQSVNRCGWPVKVHNIREHHLTDLALKTRHTARPTPLEATLSENRLDQLRRVGIMALVGLKSSDVAMLPLDTMVSPADTFSYHSLVSRFARLVIMARERLAANVEAGRIAPLLREALGTILEKYGTPGSESLEIETGKAEDGRQITVGITWKVPAALLSVPEGALVLEFLW